MKKWYSEADMVIKNAKIYTVAITTDEVKAGKEDFPIIENGAVAVKDGKIIAVEDSAAIDAFVGENTKVIDATGKVLVPGFCESHMHAYFAGNNLRNVDFRDVTSREEIKRMIKEKADATPDGEWIQGNSWNQLIWDDKTYITRKELDELAPNNPCFFMRTCFHVAMANSLALEIAGVTKDTPNPDGGVIEHYEDGEPSGILCENSALGLVQCVIPPLTDQQKVENIELIGKELNAMGLTSVIDANLNYDFMRAYNEARKQDKLTFRANLMCYLDSAFGDVDYHLRRLDEAYAVTGFGDDMLKMNGIKVTLDGVPAAGTACMRNPYKHIPGSCGSSVWTQEEITKFVCKAHETGWQFGIHTIGDRAADMAIEAFEEANKISPIWDRRNYLIHYCFPQDDQWETMKRLNINVTMQPTIVSEMGEAPILYEEQARRNQSAGLMFKNGIICGGSSDAPVVSPDPIKGMYYAVTRIDMTTEDKIVLGEESKITPKQALIMYTKNSAFFSHDDDKMGSIEVGNYADMVIVDTDFLFGEPELIRDTKVEKTIVGGKVVYEV